MKLLLINPHPGRREMPVYPLGLAALAAGLREVEVRGCDLQLADDPVAALRAALRAFEPDIAGISMRNVDSSASYDRFFYYPAFVSVVRQVRQQRPRTCIVAGGTGFSLFAEAIMDALPEIDFGVPLEGEAAFPDLLAHLAAPEQVAGIVCRANGKACPAAPRQAVDVTSLLPPAYAVFPPGAYAARGAAIGVQTKRGCAFRCVYCTYPYLDGGPIRLRPAEAVAEELELLVRQGICDVFFCDSIFNFPPEHAEAVCRAIIRRGLRLRWKAFFNERFVTDGQIGLARAAGCEFLIFGPDAGHPATLARYHKDLDINQMEAAYAACRRAGMPFKCAFMMNGPGETIATLAQTLALIARLRARAPMAFSLSTMRIYPHTDLHAEALRRGQARSGDALIKPRFYDPFPLKILTAVISAGEHALYRLRH